ncbi:hypothetical protein EUGRSUZ_F00150 [Eucalyptus grandis]|uniref:Uncharacterized protein n=2 Tax=Eucalyptus grandis TaxID=71139 RepID=A0ACC3KCP6_EUCGR|nr:hypothetical protein EUGRSUZ_F00150 [Eucalyptus grandis]
MAPIGAASAASRPLKSFHCTALLAPSPSGWRKGWRFRVGGDEVKAVGACHQHHYEDDLWEVLLSGYRRHKQCQGGQRFMEVIKDTLEPSGTDPGDFLPALRRVVDFKGRERRMVDVAKRSDVILQGMIDELRSIPCCQRATRTASSKAISWYMYNTCFVHLTYACTVRWFFTIYTSEFD